MLTYSTSVQGTSIPKQGVALTGRNRTVPPCSVGRQTSHAPGPAAADRPRALQTMTDDSVQNSTGPLGGPVIITLRSRLGNCGEMMFALPVISFSLNSVSEKGIRLLAIQASFHCSQ